MKKALMGKSVKIVHSEVFSSAGRQGDNVLYQRHQLISKKAEGEMEQFGEYIIELAETCPDGPSNSASKTLFRDRLNKWFSEYKTPDHPPYSAMIERALSELNEKNGSTEEEISHFILKQYDALPWAHLTLLESHLDTLSKSGSIVLTRGKRYILAEENNSMAPSTNGKQRKRKRKSRRALERDRNKLRKKRNQPMD